MADMMAIISKAVFEKAAGKAPSIGTKLAMDRYVSTNKNLERLADGGKLYLVTVRPPDEALWLVAILVDPKFDGEQWVARTCATPITDISDLKSKLQFESGKGLSAAKGALGMSLQTPRAVTVDDARLLDVAAGDDASAPAAKPAAAKPGRDGFPAAPEGAVDTGSGNRRALLLQAVVSEPDNLDARQVFADALVGANDPRGEFILLDTALDGPLSIRRRETLKHQREALFESNHKKWWPYKGVRLRTHRGFVEAISGSLKAINSAAAVFESEPITEVEVRGLAGVEGVERLLEAAWLTRVQRLIVRGKIRDEGFTALVQSAALANLRALNVTGNRLGPDAMAALGGNLPRCRSLVLTNNKIENAGITGLVNWKHLGQLEMLYLGNCGLTGPGFAQLLDGPPFPSLVKLALTGNNLGNHAGATLDTKAKQLPSLRHLDLVRTGIQTAGAKQVSSAALPTVKRIDLRSNRIDAKLVAEDPRITA